MFFFLLSINFTKKVGDEVNKGDEYGYFAFGGSTCICVFEANKIKIDADLKANSIKPLETLIQMGSSIGVATS